METKPIKRNIDLQPICRDHHHCLLLCWKIRKGLRKQVEIERIKKHANWFFENLIQPPFEIEEANVFPILGEDIALIKKALSEHRRLKRLFEDTDEIEKSLSRIEEELEAHIRFEERSLFKEIQEVATEEQLKQVSAHHKDSTFQENTEDEFWK